jgi:hypothetical protein
VAETGKSQPWRETRILEFNLKSAYLGIVVRRSFVLAGTNLVYAFGCPAFVPGFLLSAHSHSFVIDVMGLVGQVAT